MSIYSGSKYLKLLETGYKKSGTRLSMGKCCVRFKDLGGIDLVTIGILIQSCEVDEFIAVYETARKGK
ncbi:MAG: hypothetical protein ACKVHQ_06015 [Gammaproteobacteria bacterium]|jgi:hypothetical protein